MKPDFIVLLNIQMAFQRAGKWGMTVIQVPEIRAGKRMLGGSGDNMCMGYRSELSIPFMHRNNL
jgi:hypothetical protein